MESPARTAALGKFLVAVVNSFVEDKDGARKRGSGPSGKRKRLHVLYLLHDVFYHTLKRHPGNDDFGRNIEGHLAPLFSSVSAFPDAPKHSAKILDLLTFWEESDLLGPDIISNLRSLVEKAGENDTAGSKDTLQGAIPTSGKLPKEAPFTLPPTHGDPSVAWFDLPAANWLPHLTPNSTKPMKPGMIKPLQFAQGPADKAVVEAVKSLLSKVDQLFAKERKWDEHSDLNEMGERVVLDEVTGEVVDGETYYGWSRAFCKKMKDRHSKPQEQRGRSRSRSDTRSTPRSSSASPPRHKRRRLSRSYSRSRSPTPAARRKAERPRGGSRSRSPERYRRSRSPSRRRTRSRTPSPQRHRTERRYGRSPSPGNDGMAGKAPFYPPPPPPQVPHQQAPHQQPPVRPHQIPPPPPPPPPHGYTGPWPPPPPPFPPGGVSQPQGWTGAPGAPPGPLGAQQFSHGPGGYQGDYGKRARGRG